MGNHTNHSSNDDLSNINFSNYPFINDKWIIKPTSQIIIESTIYAPVVIFGIFGNLLSLYVLIKNSHICTPTNMLIGNMAVADLLSLLIHPWVFLTYDFFQNYQLGEIGCKTEAAIECAIFITSVINVSAISYDRLTAILLPQESKLTKQKTKIVMLATWILGILISSPLYFSRVYKERQWMDFLEKYCTEDTFMTTIYWHVIITVIVWLPLTIQLICYISIFIKLSKYEKMAVRKLNHRQVDYKKKAIRMMFTMILTFLICRLPFTALIFYRDQNRTSSNSNVINTVIGTYHTLWFLSKFFIFLNSALNPLIYSVTNDKFQKGFKATTLGKWLCPPNPKQNKVFIPKENLKTPPESSTLFKKSIFFIFKRKQKLSTALTDVGSELSVARYDQDMALTKK